MIFGSAASGIEAASVAWNPLGWRAAWLSEIDPFASGVLAYRHPDVPNLGDMTRLPEWILSGVITAPDVFVAGTPCQAFSIAGLRKSLEDARGNLSLTYCEIVNAIDTARAERNEEPCIAVWENVPGVLSTKDNAFGCFLAGLAGEDVPLVAAGGKWPDAGLVVGPARAVAWRVLDAQFFGVAQRRRRVFVVASARDGFDPGAVLFEFDGVRRDTPPVRETREETPAGALRGTDGGIDVDRHVVTMAHGQGGAEIASDRAPTLTCNHEAPIAFLPETAHTLRGEGFDASEDGTGRRTPLVAIPLLEVGKRTGVSTTDPRAGIGIGKEGDPMFTLQAGAQHGVAVGVALRGRDGGAACEVGDDVAFTLRASSGGGDKPHVLAPVAFNWNAQPCQMNFNEDTTPTLTCSQGADGGPLPGMRVRRLTPRECERLQGFPDDYTRIPWKPYQSWAKRQSKGLFESFDAFLRKLTATTEDCPDGPRYKALGNSMAVPVMEWIGARIVMHLEGAI